MEFSAFNTSAGGTGSLQDSAEYTNRARQPWESLERSCTIHVACSRRASEPRTACRRSRTNKNSAEGSILGTLRSDLSPLNPDWPAVYSLLEKAVYTLAENDKGLVGCECVEGDP